jgi:hypothetical protein
VAYAANLTQLVDLSCNLTKTALKRELMNGATIDIVSVCQLNDLLCFLPGRCHRFFHQDVATGADRFAAQGNMAFRIRTDMNNFARSMLQAHSQLVINIRLFGQLVPQGLCCPQIAIDDRDNAGAATQAVCSVPVSHQSGANNGNS